MRLGGDYDLIDEECFETITNLDDEAEYISSNGMYFINRSQPNFAGVNTNPLINAHPEISPAVRSEKSPDYENVPKDSPTDNIECGIYVINPETAVDYSCSNISGD